MIPRRGVLALISTVIALVLLLGYRTPDRPIAVATLVVAPGSASSGSGSSSGSSAAHAPSANSATQAPGPTTAAGYTGTVTGTVVATPFGNVQVQAKLSSGRIVEVTTLQTPSDQTRSAMIARYAVPILRSEALTAQSAQINMVSGATYTSDGYAQSLQAALDQAKA